MSWSSTLSRDVEQIFVEAQRLGRRNRARCEAPYASLTELNGGLSTTTLDLLMTLTVVPRVSRAARRLSMTSGASRRSMSVLVERELVSVRKERCAIQGQERWHARLTEKGWLLLLGRVRVATRVKKPRKYAEVAPLAALG